MYDPIVMVWITLLSSISSFGIFLIISQNKIASQFYVYGKSLNLKGKGGVFWNTFLVPKRFFSHFYVSALLMFMLCYFFIFFYYLPTSFGARFREKLSNAIEILDHLPIEVKVVKTLESVTSLFFTVILMTIQTSRRLFESLFVSVYSSNSKINIIHYVFGHAFYILVALSTIVPILLSKTSSEYTITNIMDNILNRNRTILFILFIYASLQQHKCHKILANLRKDKIGNVITEEYFPPSGSLFEYVSCPHFLIEIILYLFILISQRFENTYWNLAFLLVLSTQTINAISEHEWYKKKFKDYPKHRRALIPHIL